MSEKQQKLLPILFLVSLTLICWFLLMLGYVDIEYDPGLKELPL